MSQWGRSHDSRIAIRTFQVAANAMILRGYFRLGGKSGQTLQKELINLSPEIYGTMNDPRRIELQGLEYIIDRLPRGIEECRRFVMGVTDDLEETSFERIVPPARRRVSYRVSDEEMCFVISRGMSEIYDILTHLTFLYIEAKHIHSKKYDGNNNPTHEWERFEKDLQRLPQLKKNELEKALWNLSIILGRTYHETKSTYEHFEDYRENHNGNSGLFRIVASLAERIEMETTPRGEMTVIFRPVLIDTIVHQIHGKMWAAAVKAAVMKAGLENRPLHIISANLHSIRNLLYGYAAVAGGSDEPASDNIYEFVAGLRHQGERISEFARQHGFHEIKDQSGAHIDCQLIDTFHLEGLPLHPALDIDSAVFGTKQPVILVMDYAFGLQAFELMDELLNPKGMVEVGRGLYVRSISVMGKAGTLPGKKGDIMLATAHVLEGAAHNYMVQNDLEDTDFDNDIDVYSGPVLTVLGTSLQNRDLLEKFHTSTWRAVGLEMEGGHYQRAIDAAIIRGHISKNVKLRYAYYASDNPLVSGQTLASGSLGEEGVRPTYMISLVILKKILGGVVPKTEAAAP